VARKDLVIRDYFGKFRWMGYLVDARGDENSPEKQARASEKVSAEAGFHFTSSPSGNYLISIPSQAGSGTPVAPPGLRQAARLRTRAGKRPQG
jgi:hypothetical protein